MTLTAPFLRAAPQSGAARPLRAILMGFATCLVLPALTAEAATPHHATHARPGHGSVAPAANPPEDAILGTINGQVLTERDVDNRGKLFALSTGLNISADLMQRLRPNHSSAGR